MVFIRPLISKSSSPCTNPLVAEIRWSVYISKSERNLCVSFSRTRFWAVLMPFVRMVKFKFLELFQVDHKKKKKKKKKNIYNPTSLSLSLSLSHTHTHTHTRASACVCVCVILKVYRWIVFSHTIKKGNKQELWDVDAIHIYKFDSSLCAWILKFLKSFKKAEVTLFNKYLFDIITTLFIEFLSFSFNECRLEMKYERPARFELSFLILRSPSSM